MIWSSIKCLAAQLKGKAGTFANEYFYKIHFNLFETKYIHLVLITKILKMCLSLRCEFCDSRTIWIEKENRVSKKSVEYSTIARLKSLFNLLSQPNKIDTLNYWMSILSLPLRQVWSIVPVKGKQSINLSLGIFPYFVLFVLLVYNSFSKGNQYSLKRDQCSF